MLRLKLMSCGLGMLCTISLVGPAQAEITVPRDTWAPPGDHRTPPSHLPSRPQRNGSGLAPIAGELNDQLPSEASGSQRARRSIYDPSSGRQQLQQSKRIVRRRPGGSQVPAPGALALAALGGAMVVRMKKSFS